MKQEQSGYYYDELAFIEATIWPFDHEDRAEGITLANELAPGKAVWMYSETGDPGYHLLLPKRWENIELENDQ